MLPTILRAIALYVGFLLLLRILGKREIGQFSPFDLVVTLILAEIADGVIFGEAPPLEGAAVVATIGILHKMNSWLSFRSRSFSRLVEGSPTILIKNGIVRDVELRRERIRRDELLALLRLRGKTEEDIPEIDCATLEIDGELSVLSRQRAE